MTYEQAIELANKLKISVRGHYDESGCTPFELFTFADEIAKIEREECAKICEHNKIDIPEFTGDADTNRSLDFAAYCIRNKA